MHYYKIQFYTTIKINRNLLFLLNINLTAQAAYIQIKLNCLLLSLTFVTVLDVYENVFQVIYSNYIHKLIHTIKSKYFKKKT